MSYGVKSSNSTNFNRTPQSSATRATSSMGKSTFSQGGASIVKSSDSKKTIDPVLPVPKTTTLREPSRYPSYTFEDKKDYRSENLKLSEERKDYRCEVTNKGIVGLRNLGNTCYMNSILQCLARLPPLFTSILKITKSDINPRSKLDGKLAFAFRDFIVELRNSPNQSTVSPYEIKSQIGKFCKQFSGYDQQDSSEFFRTFLDALGQELNRVQVKPGYQEMTGNSKEDLRKVADRWWDYSLSREDSLINDVFQGQLSSVITCGKCGYGSVSCDPFLSLNLPSPESMSRTEVEDLLELYFKQTTLPSSYVCENCKKSGACSQKISIFRLPKVLVLQVKRFQVSAFSRTRLNTEVRMREELSLRNFVNERGEAARGYVLKGISHHTGTLYFGHYIAECREDSTWYCFDDSRAYNVSPPVSSSSAYLLFYTSA